MMDDYDPLAKMNLRPMQTVLLDNFNLAPKARHVFDKMHVGFLNIGLRVISTGEVIAFIEEFDGSEWVLCDTTPTIPGETVCSHRLKSSDFRVGVENPSETEAQTVTLEVKWMGPAENHES